MKFITAILTLALAAVCAAQPDRPPIGILAAVEGCSPMDVLERISCGCFTTLFGAPTDAKLRAMCRTVTGTAVRASQATCDDFLIDNGSNYDFDGILDSLEFVKNRCFGGDLTFARNLDDIIANFEILMNAEQLFILVNKLCEAFGRPTVSDIPHPDRMIAGANLKTTLLRQYNNI